MKDQEVWEASKQLGSMQAAKYPAMAKRRSTLKELGPSIPPKRKEVPLLGLLSLFLGPDYSDKLITQFSSSHLSLLQVLQHYC